VKNINSGLVSIITPAFNSALFISQTIESVLKQTHPNWELLIVTDAGTTDNTANVVQEYTKADSRIKHFHLQNTRGVSASRNKALDEANGQFVAFLDSDDLWLPEKLEKQINFMLKEKIPFSCTSYRKTDEQGNVISRVITPPRILTYDSLLKNNELPCLTAMYDRQLIGTEHRLIEHTHEDYIFWLSLLKTSKKCVSLPEDLARYRVVPNSRSMRVNKPKGRWQVYRNIEKLSLTRSSFSFCLYAISAISKRIFS
jgi:teichuronic acid biosynthesis glycosyltransferase TuaG